MADNADKVHIPTHTMTTPQLQRAWALILVKQLWPTIDAGNGLAIARWIYDNRAGDRS